MFGGLETDTEETMAMQWKEELVQGSPLAAHLSFLLDPGIPGPIYGSKSLKLCNRPCADLTDVTLTDEDTNSILTDNANRAFQGNVATRVTQPGGQLWNQAMQVT